MAYSFYEASKAISQTPSLEFKDRLQALIDNRFEVATNIVDIQEETIIGSKIWEDITVRLNHKINVDTGVRLSDDWRNVTFQDTQHITALGIKYKIDADIWITINTENKHMVTSSCLIRRCNWTLKWYNDKGILIQEPCIVDYVKMIGSAMGVMDGKQVREGTYDRFAYLQLNDETAKLKRDDRFFIDDLVFRITKKDRIAHNGLVELSLDEHQINLEVDDTLNYIADYTIRPNVDNSDIGTTELFNDISTLSTATTGLWEIFKKKNGVIQSDTYTFAITSGSGASIVSTSANTVSLKAGLNKGLTLVLTATNVTTSAVINKTIQIVGMW